MSPDQDGKKQPATEAAQQKPQVEKTEVKKDELAEGQLENVKGGVTSGAMA